MPSPSLDQLRRAVGEELNQWLSSKRAELPEAGPLIDEIERLLAAGGKRIRPAFCYWGFRAAGGSGDAVLRAAASLELLHTFAIVHDDIMDAAPVRRGVPSVHARVGEAVAILVGDLSLVLADDLFMTSRFPAETLQRGFEAYSRMRAEVIAGQYLDVVSSETEPSEERARRTAVLKSALYSVEEPLVIGGLLAGARPSVLDGLARFGRPLGEAFQLRDDLLGTFGEEAATGKPVDSDVREGKRNLLFARAAARLGEPERSFFVGRWGGGDALDHDEVARLRSLVESCGARREVEALRDDLRAQALRALGPLDCDEDARSALRELALVAAG